MDIHQYILNSERTYAYRIKTVVPLDDNMMGRVERTILKYQPVSMTAPKKTMLQANPLDFANVQNAEVYFIDVVLGLPASGAQLEKELARFMEIPDKFVVVRGENDPLELQTQEIDAKAAMDEAEGEDAKKGSVLTLPNYEEAVPTKTEDYFGTEYNKRFLGYLSKVEKERKEAMKVDSPNGAFKWLDMPKSDTPEDPGPTIGTADGVENEDRSFEGNLQDSRKTYTRTYQRKGDTYVKREAGDPVRKGK